MPRYVLIANPGTKRCETYRRELLAYWSARGESADLEIVPWADVVPRGGCLDGLPAFDRPAVVRLESPGKDDWVTRLLLEAGASDDPLEPPRDWRALEIPKGLLVRPGLLYCGFRQVLAGLRRSFDARPHLRPTACPLAVAHMFDKNHTLATLAAAGVPVPGWVPPEQVSSFEDGLFHVLCHPAWPVVYAKLNTGASATGIVVVHNRPEAVYGVTTMAQVGREFYNTRRVRHVRDHEISECLGLLQREGMTVQRGIPMAQIDGQNFDVRVVCVYGKPVASIFRLSSLPMTNLHLGGRRGDFARCRAEIPSRAWLDALDHCVEAAGCFDSAVAGVDLVFEHGYRRHYVLEVNAFGDFFPGWVDADGRSIHALEIEATLSRGAVQTPLESPSAAASSRPSSLCR
jgi:hypothetical protein